MRFALIDNNCVEAQATREQVIKQAKYLRTDQNDLIISWLSDKLAYEVQGEELAKQALKAAEIKVDLQRENK